jgi:hypothetical protein
MPSLPQKIIKNEPRQYATASTTAAMGAAATAVTDNAAATNNANATSNAATATAATDNDAATAATTTKNSSTPNNSAPSADAAAWLLADANYGKAATRMVENNPAYTTATSTNSGIPALKEAWTNFSGISNKTTESDIVDTEKVCQTGFFSNL